MKNILKILPILFLMIIVSCKKKDSKPEVFDITKYSIVGKFADGLPYIISIEAGNKITLTNYSFSSGTFTYTDGILKFNFDNGEMVGSFTIENGAIKSYAGPVLINTYDLVKIPATNQLESKTFKGIWQNSAYKTELKFGATKYTEITNNRQTEASYTLINNLAAKKQEVDKITLFIMMDGKLEGLHYANPIRIWGTFMKQ